MLCREQSAKPIKIENENSISKEFCNVLSNNASNLNSLDVNKVFERTKHNELKDNMNSSSRSMEEHETRLSNIVLPNKSLGYEMTSKVHCK